MKHLLRLFALILAMTLLASSALAYPKGFVAYNGSREEKKIAITVDDCYDADVLRMMHELCVEYDFPITWFVLGTQIRDEDKALWEAIIAHGSEIGNQACYQACGRQEQQHPQACKQQQEKITPNRKEKRCPLKSLRHSLQ